MFFPIFLHAFSHATSETRLFVRGGLGVIWKFCLYILLSVVWPGLGRKGWHLDLNWLICIKLGSWSCQLWYQRPSWVLTLLKKQDSGYISFTFFNSKFVSSYRPPLRVCHNSSDPWKMKHYVCFIFNQIFLHSSHILVVRNNFNWYPIIPQINWKFILKKQV